MAEEEIRKHYHLNHKDYNLWMDSEKHGMMHYGDHSSYERSLKERLLFSVGLLTKKEISSAVIHRVQTLAEKAEIREGNVVLDSGCGRGGNTIWLARNTEASKVIGLDIDEKLIEEAREKAEKEGVQDRTEFVQGSFDDLPVEDFDVYFAIESQCHSENEEKLVDQIFRAMNPGGRLVISDGFRTEKFSEEKHMEISRKMHIGWGVDYLCRRSDFEKFLEKAGFQNIESDSIKEEIGPFSRYLHRICVAATPYVDLRLLNASIKHRIWQMFGRESEKHLQEKERYRQVRKLLTTGRYQYIAGTKRIFTQYDFYAEKPGEE